MDINALSQMAGAAPLVPAVATPPPLPDDLVISDFGHALNGAGVAAGPGAAGTAPRPANLAGRTVGDAILAGMEQLSGETLNAWGVIKHKLPEGANIATADLINFQASVLQFTFLYELVGKGVSKSAQNLDSLVKLQ